MSDQVIEVTNLRKTYSDVNAVKKIDLHVDHKKMFALLKPNRTSKTTTTKILKDFQPKTTDKVNVLNHDPTRQKRDLKNHIRIVLQSTSVDPYLTVQKTINLYSNYFPKPQNVDKIINLINLNERQNTRIS